MKRTKIHNLFRWYVWWRTGFTHWSSGALLTFDPACPWCKALRLFGKDQP
jgi:hypothetical protein